MSLSVWTEISGYSLGTFDGETSLDIPLPVTNATGVTFTLISGSLPNGLFLIGHSIVGSAFTTNSILNYTFCIRATKGNSFSDRTFTLNLSGTKPPVFVTATGNLDIGPAKQYYVLDGSYVDYQLEAFDLDTAPEKLNWFIGSSDGELPPGLEMDNQGRITGYIIPVLTLTPAIGNGYYDGSIFDAVAFDFGQTASDGFDNYSYDDVDFDFNVPAQQLISLNANYQFRVTITDGTNTVQRIFRIFVVGSDQFRADSTSNLGLADNFSADATYIRQPVWINQSNLGLFRSSNYLTIPLALYDVNNVSFRLEATNKEVYALSLQQLNTDNRIGSHHVTITNSSAVPEVGQYFSLLHYLDGADSKLYQISNVEVLGTNSYRLTIYTSLIINVPNGTPFYIGSLSALPPGTTFSEATGEIYGVVPYQPAITKQYKFTVTATRYGLKTDSVSASKTFTISILGDITSQIIWNTNSNLGSVPANYDCTLSVSAVSSVPNVSIIYELLDGSLPPGLALSPDGEIIGKINQFYRPETSELGLITFDSYVSKLTDLPAGLINDPRSAKTNSPTTFDNNTTTFDRTYTASIQASDQYNYTATVKEFTISVSTPNSVNYSNVVAKPFLNVDQRTYWKEFITDTNIFTPDSVYRTNDPVFGVQSELKMLIYAGIETTQAAAYIGAIGLNHKRKRFLFNGFKKAIAIDSETGEDVYEVIYAQMQDPLEPNNTHLPLKIVASHQPDKITIDNSNSIWSRNLSDLQADAPDAVRPNLMITADSQGYETDINYPNRYFPSSISNWRTRLKSATHSDGSSLSSERNYLPLWMRSIPEGDKKQLGYVLAVPLCFCKIGTADKILLNIKHSDFDFKNIDYTIDRFIIDSVSGYYQDKYLVFRNDKITV